MDRLDGLNPALMVRAEEREERESINISSDLIIHIFSHLSLADWRQNCVQLVSWQWRNCSFSKPLFERLVSPFLMGSDKWGHRRDGNLKVLPESIRPGLDPYELIAKRCPFNEKKFFLDTHLIAYKGEKFQAETETGPLVLPISINTLNQVSGHNAVCIYANLHKRGESVVENETIKKAAWVALYKEPASIFRKDGVDLDPQCEGEGIQIMDKEGYYHPSLLEFATIIHIHGCHTDQKEFTWPSSTKKTFAVFSEKFDVDAEDERLFISAAGCGVSTQFVKYDISGSNYWYKQGTFGLMACKEL